MISIQTIAYFVPLGLDALPILEIIGQISLNQNHCHVFLLATTPNIKATNAFIHPQVESISRGMLYSMNLSCHTPSQLCCMTLLLLKVTFQALLNGTRIILWKIYCSHHLLPLLLLHHPQFQLRVSLHHLL